MSVANEPSTHNRGAWAPSTDRRLKAVRSELDTMAELRDSRGLTVSEQRYLEHLRRRETELEAEAADDAAKAAAADAQRARF